MVHRLPSARRRIALKFPALRRAVAVAWLALALPACFVEVIDKGGGSACTPTTCSGKGVCTGWTGTCSVNAAGKAVCATWKIADTKAILAGTKSPVGYEAGVEKSCDNLDNNCDGLTDEGTADASKCTATGVCSTGKASGAACVFGQLRCDWGVTPAFEVSESTCDGKDNDCDGATDEGAVPGAFDCPRKGVCAGLAAATCAAGAWDCGVAAAPDYEVTETKCDGKDNDCDGIADANLSLTALPGGATCPDKGVCTGVSVVCQGGVATCAVGQVPGYEAVEKACDGKDNDCDGQTDTVTGSGQPLAASDISACSKPGVCSGAPAGTIASLCVAGQFTCSFKGVPGYEATETLCDGKDNDCDGTVDGPGLAKAAKSPCGNVGVCAADAALCEAGLWLCDYKKIAGYEAFEQSCDGKDNDCDGKTDESLDPAVNQCKSLGVCGFGATVACSAGKAACDYSHVLGYQESTETVCDGLDNDCDGNTDEQEALDAAKSGCAVGVCAGKAKATCTAAKWACDTTGVAGFEAQEATCDGKDNDCDGFVDENLASATAAKCLAAGACKVGVAAGCVGGKYLCSYAGVAGYEATEAACDGIDNDCDGKTDAAACAPGSACTASDQCQGGECVGVFGGTGKVCTEKAGQCAQGGSGDTVLVNEGGGACSGTGATVTCQKGAFGAPATCPQSSPTCVGGACGICAPNATTCDPADKTKIVQCAADGKSFVTKGACASGSHCVSAGLCVSDASVTVSEGGNAAAPVGVALKDGTAAVAWLSGSEVRLRMLGTDGKPKAASEAVQAGAAPLADGKLAVVAVGSGFALAWTTGTASEANVALRLFDAAGKATSAILNPHPDFGDGAQRDPALASNGTALLVAWSDDQIDGDGFAIAAQRFDAAGKLVGGLIAVNDDATVPDATVGNQTQPAAAMRTGGEFAVAWTHTSGSSKRIRARAYGADGTVASTVKSLTATGVVNQSATLIASKTEYLGAWTSGDIEGASGTGIGYGRLDAALKLIASLVALNKVTAGDQDEPTLAVRTDGTAVAVWRSVGAAGAENGSEVAARDIAQGQPTGDELGVTKANPLGDQDQARVLLFADGRVLYVFRHRANATAPGEIAVLFR